MELPSIVPSAQTDHTPALSQSGFSTDHTWTKWPFTKDLGPCTLRAPSEHSPMALDWLGKLTQYLKHLTNSAELVQCSSIPVEHALFPLTTNLILPIQNTAPCVDSQFGINNLVQYNLYCQVMFPKDAQILGLSGGSRPPLEPWYRGVLYLSDSRSGYGRASSLLLNLHLCFFSGRHISRIAQSIPSSAKVKSLTSSSR